MFKGSRALPILSLPPPDLQAWTQKGLQTVFAHAQASVALFHSNKWSRTLKPSFTLLTPHNIQYEAGIICVMVSVGCIYHLACKISWNQDFTANTVQKWSSSWDRPMTEWRTQKKIIINRNERFPFAVLLPGHCKTGFSWTVAMQQLISVLERRRFWAEKQTPTNINKSVDLWSCTCFNITKGILKQYDLIISTHSLCAWFITCREICSCSRLWKHTLTVMLKVKQEERYHFNPFYHLPVSLKYWLLSVHMAGYTLHLLACRFTNRPINPPSKKKALHKIKLCLLFHISELN